MVQFSHPYMTAGKIIALTIQTFAGKVMSLLFDMLPRLENEILVWIFRISHGAAKLLVNFRNDPGRL